MEDTMLIRELAPLVGEIKNIKKVVTDAHLIQVSVVIDEDGYYGLGTETIAVKPVRLPSGEIIYGNISKDKTFYLRIRQGEIYPSQRKARRKGIPHTVKRSGELVVRR